MTVHVGYPPDTDTPGFSHEAATMVRRCSCASTNCLAPAKTPLVPRAELLILRIVCALQPPEGRRIQNLGGSEIFPPAKVNW